MRQMSTEVDWWLSGSTDDGHRTLIYRLGPNTDYERVVSELEDLVD